MSYGNPRPENVRTLTRRSNAVESQTEDWKAHFIYHLRGFGDLSEKTKGSHTQRRAVGTTVYSVGMSFGQHTFSWISCIKLLKEHGFFQINPDMFDLLGLQIRA